MDILVVIPARMASTRFPGKPLCDLGGKPMVQWVVEAAKQAAIGPIVVATPDAEIYDACRSFGADAVMTRGDHVSGTDRIAEVAEQRVADAYVNVQGDEPLIVPETIRACAAPLSDAGVPMTSVFARCPDADRDNPAVVKVVTDLVGNALYFSRHPIPFSRSGDLLELKKHIGIYGYRRDVLRSFAGWEVSPLERAESLEQLRFLENGVSIRMALGTEGGLAVDTPEQADEVRLILSSR